MGKDWAAIQRRLDDGRCFVFLFAYSSLTNFLRYSTLARAKAQYGWLKLQVHVL